MMRSLIILFIFNLVILSACTSISQPISLYTSSQGEGAECIKSRPCSLQDAQELARQLMQENPQDIRVFLHGGTYQLDSPWNFGSEDSGLDGFTIYYLPYRNEKPVISGGADITNWESAGNGIFKAKVPGLRTRQLYVGGKRAVRAREPNQENETDMGPYLRFLKWDIENHRLQVLTKDISVWGNEYQGDNPPMNPVEMIVQSHWHLYIFRVENLLAESGKTWVVPSLPERDEPSFGHIASLDPQGDPQKQESYYWENSYEFLDVPGEWYLDEIEEVLYYKPRQGENLTEIRVVAPNLETLVNIEGQANQFVENLVFKGLAFEYSTWLGPSDTGYAPWQAALRSSSHSGDPFPGALRIANARNISIISNEFRHTGMHGLVTAGFTHKLQIEGNSFDDLSGAAIMLDVIANPEGGSVGDRIANNRIHQTGRVYTDACGIWASFPDGLVIEHNELSNLPYTGISIGWRWNTSPTAAQNNYIAHNHIFHVMQKHDDGAGIYILGSQPGTRLFGNYIHNLEYSSFSGSYPIAGVYLDEGSDEMTLGSHLIINVPRGNEVNLHKTGPNIYYNKPVLLDPESELAQELAKTAGPEP